MIPSRSSTIDADPLSDAIAGLGARRLRCTRLEAAGAWSLAFPARTRLKFVAVLRGCCWLSLPGDAGRGLAAGDAVVLGDTPFTVASDPALPAADGAPLYAASVDVARFGGDDTVMLGGGLVFADGPMRSLLGALPPALPIPAASAPAVRDALVRLEEELGRPRPGGPLLAARLADILLVEALRARAEDGAAEDDGGFAALADRQIGAALRLMHGDLAAAWTVGRLAAAVGLSRSAFASRFARLVGRPPLDHLRHQRLTLACRTLAEGGAGIAEVAARTGYGSPSAFGHAYKRAFGVSPRRHGRAVLDA